jgi:hypothetical protein
MATKRVQYADCGSSTRRYISTRCRLPLQSDQSALNRHLSTVLLFFSPQTPLLPSHTIFPQDALHCFDCPFLCSLCSVFQWVSLPNYMPTNFLTLFAAMAYAAPVAPQGAILNRQCEGSGCRDVSVGSCLYKRVVI